MHQTVFDGLDCPTLLQQIEQSCEIRLARLVDQSVVSSPRIECHDALEKRADQADRFVPIVTGNPSNRIAVREYFGGALNHYLPRIHEHAERRDAPLTTRQALAEISDLYFTVKDIKEKVSELQARIESLPAVPPSESSATLPEVASRSLRRPGLPALFLPFGRAFLLECQPQLSNHSVVGRLNRYGDGPKVAALPDQVDEQITHPGFLVGSTAP